MGSSRAKVQRWMEAGEEQALQAADLEAAEAMATVLRATDGVRMVSFYGRDKSKLNSQRIKVKVDAPADDDQGRAVIELTANWSADVDTWRACAELAMRKVAAIVGSPAIAAEQQKLELLNSPAPGQQAPSDAELEWLAHCFDSQPEPDAVTTDAAVAALSLHRAARGSSSSSSSSAFAQSCTRR